VAVAVVALRLAQAVPLLVVVAQVLAVPLLE
jgi:hypothetical protein